MITIETSALKEVQPGFETVEKIQLIDGNFSVHDAQDVLMDLINHKIQYHELKNFSWEERFGEPNSNSQKRLKELKADREKLKAVLEFAGQNGLSINLQGKVEIHLTK